MVIAMSLLRALLIIIQMKDTCRYVNASFLGKNRKEALLLLEMMDFTTLETSTAYPTQYRFQ